jgi:hypothetical protein
MIIKDKVKFTSHLSANQLIFRSYVLFDLWHMYLKVQNYIAWATESVNK